MRHALQLRVGPIGFRIGSVWREPIALLRSLYAGYPEPEGGVPNFTVRIEPPNLVRRFVRRQVAIAGDFIVPDALPLPYAQALLAAEMSMNLQLALGERRFLLLHAAAVERDGRAVVMTGLSGSGKSTLAALLGSKGWRFLGDEFALLDPESGSLHPFPRPVSLKNESIGEVTRLLPGARFGPLLAGTPKGDIRHLVPARQAIAAMDEPARPALILFPSYGHAPETRPMPRSETFVRLTQASTNYLALGERGFSALTKLVAAVPALAIDYPDTATAIGQVEDLWRAP